MGVVVYSAERATLLLGYLATLRESERGNNDVKTDGPENVEGPAERLGTNDRRELVERWEKCR